MRICVWSYWKGRQGPPGVLVLPAELKRDVGLDGSPATGPAGDERVKPEVRAELALQRRIGVGRIFVEDDQLVVAAEENEAKFSAAERVCQKALVVVVARRDGH